MSSEIDVDAFENDIGSEEHYDLGPVTRREARRYARATEDDNPLFHDVEYARENGYDDVVVPPNYLPAIIDYTAGPPAAELREDGLDPNFLPITLPPEATLMGGGQSLSFERYVTAGEAVNVTETFTGLSQRESDAMGTLTFVETEFAFSVGDEHVLTCEETMIVGERR